MTTLVRVPQNQYKGRGRSQSQNTVLNPAKGEKFRNLNAT